MKFSLSLHMERFSPSEDLTRIKNEVLTLVRMADEGGFVTVWTPEHHTIEFTIAPGPFSILTWWAAHTERVRLGTATIVAPYWTPIRLAGEAALCDHLIDGRLELGIARGAYQYEFDRMAGGIPQQLGGAYLRELVPAVKKLWEGDYAHDGEFYKFPTATSVPKPLQQPHPPLWVAARDPQTYDWALKVGANIMATPLSSPMAEVANLGNKFRKACADNPDVPRPKFMMLRRACVYERPEDWEIPVKMSIDYGRSFENLFQNIGTVKNGFPEWVSYDNVANRQNYDPHAVRDAMLFGTPDEVVEKLFAYEAAGVDEVCLGISFNNPFEMQKKTLELFIREVMPVFAERQKERAKDKGQAAASTALAG
ncbi:LLM class flavin-dependent oxidoreductase [Rhodoligotrophos defluvii]|uniref:LLM class flavin-dependent oxidoreductase n=1 Tax=Rhodoligotrophos defluvii TaxID=2561934 RepID=UPI0010C9C550|nr:LLM class flavin-dependent oxidoreductase [Rhodoligotrophos defluvii]